MDRPDVLGLINCCDAYASLHSAEGFGRTIAEAILHVNQLLQVIIMEM